jgi:hypothetical protein
MVLEVSTDIRFRMLFKGLGLMEEAHPLLVHHGNPGITTAVYHPDNIPVRLSTVRHESFKLGFRNTVLCHDINSSKVPSEQQHPLTAYRKPQSS